MVPSLLFRADSILKLLAKNSGRTADHVRLTFSKGANVIFASRKKILFLEELAQCRVRLVVQFLLGHFKIKVLGRQEEKANLSKCFPPLSSARHSIRPCGLSIDIPGKYGDTDLYRATLGHKVNHKFNPTTFYDNIESPR